MNHTPHTALVLLQRQAADAHAHIDTHPEGFALRVRSGFVWLLPNLPRLIEALHLLTGKGPR